MLRLQLWDTAGKIQKPHSELCEGLPSCLIIYDITNEGSYESLTRWVDFVKENRGEDVMIMVAGNKIDLEQQRKVNFSTIEAKCKEIGEKHYELSAKTGEKVKKMFQQVCAQLIQVSIENMSTLEKQKSKLISNVSLSKDKAEVAIKKKKR